jgi:hypothetical protein
MLVSDKAALKMRILYSAPASIVDFQHLRVYRSRSSALAFNRLLVCIVTVSARIRRKTPCSRRMARRLSVCTAATITDEYAYSRYFRGTTLRQRRLRHANVRTGRRKKSRHVPGFIFAARSVSGPWP